LGEILGMFLLKIVSKTPIFCASREKTLKDGIIILIVVKINNNVPFWLKLTLCVSAASERFLGFLPPPLLLPG
jgi:hypothetical protein